MQSRDEVSTPVRGTDEHWTYEIVRRRSDDVVVAAAIFKPNAPGDFSLSLGGFGDRQMLKACCAYLGERILLGVTPLHVHAIEVFGGARFSRTVARWPRDDVAVTAVPARRGRGSNEDPSWPAMLICRRSGRPLAELQAFRREPSAERVVDLLVRGASVVEDAGGTTGAP
jgi:hypothetical protein